MERIEMHRLQELVRLHRMGVGCRVIARQLKMSPNTERLYREVLEETGWLMGPVDELPSLEALQEVVLIHRPKRALTQHISKLEGYRDAIAVMFRSGAQPKAIFDRLRLEHDNFRGSLSSVKRLCRRLRAEEGLGADQVSMPVETAPGEVAQVDFGSVGSLYDPSRGVFRKAYVFVMTLGYSRHSYYGLSWDQKASTWLRLHQEAFQYFGGVPKVIVPDNLKSAVTRAAFTPDEPSTLCLSYREFAQYHGFQIDPTPPYAPQKKGKVEAGVKYVKQNFFAPRRAQKDFPVLDKELARWSKEIAAERIHGTTYQKPIELFETQEKAALLPLPEKSYETVLWKVAKVHRDCCVQYNGTRYSVPWRLVGKEVLLRATPKSIIVLFENVRVATHESAPRGQAVIEPAHLPEVRSDYRHRTREYWEQRADALGSEVGRYVREVFAHDDVLCQLRSVQAMVTHLEGFPRERREAACKRARLYGNHTYKGLKGILQKALDRQPLPTFFEESEQDLPREEKTDTSPTYRFARPIGELVH